MKKFACAVVATLCAVGFVVAEDFTLQITKIGDDGSVTGTKIAAAVKGKKGGGGKGEEYTGKLAKGVGIFKGKFDTDSKAFVKEGDDLGIAGLKTALKTAENGTITVEGKALGDKDVVELCIKDGKPCAKLNGKDVDADKVRIVGKAALTTRVTTGDDGGITTVLITAGGKGGFGKGAKGGGGN